MPGGELLLVFLASVRRLRVLEAGGLAFGVLFALQTVLIHN